MSKPLSGKAALIMSGTRGIGAATARSFAEQGADVAISYSVATAKAEALVYELEALGVRALALKADPSEPREVEGIVREVHKHFGRLDILVNNGGTFVTGRVDDPDADWEELQRQQKVNVDGVVAAVRAAAPLLPEGGRIVNVGSTAATHVPCASVADYCASRAALIAYTKGWARDLGPRHITVNNVQPGPIDIDMNPDQTELAETLRSRTALHRYGRAHEVAAAITFLASPGASYITGTTLNVDGGQTA